MFDKKRQIIPYILTACFHVTVPDSKPSWQQPMLLHLLWTVSLSAGHRVGAARTAVCRVWTSAPPAWHLHGWPTAGLCPSTDTASNVLQEPWFGNTLKSYTHLLVGVHYLLMEQPAIHNVFFFPPLSLFQYQLPTAALRTKSMWASRSQVFTRTWVLQGRDLYRSLSPHPIISYHRNVPSKTQKYHQFIFLITHRGHSKVNSKIILKSCGQLETVIPRNNPQLCYFCQFYSQINTDWNYQLWIFFPKELKAIKQHLKQLYRKKPNNSTHSSTVFPPPLSAKKSSELHSFTSSNSLC